MIAESLRQIVHPFLEMRFADVVDIVVVTALLYAVLALIRSTQAAFVAMGIVLLGVLYIVARALDLRLTAWIFQGFFAVFLLILVVVFQEELRQLFESVAVWSLGRGEQMPTSVDPTHILVSCLVDFARDRTGALIVLPGTHPIARHVQGGIDLNGKVSVPLLASIFDKHSPGHDGAAILENDQITRFAVHLPLSKDFGQLVQRGTRHSAALGLAERTDALCLVVSEERGEISVARDGRLRVIRSPHEVAAVIQEFSAEKRPVAERGRIWFQLLREHGIEKAVAFVLVLALWYLFVPGSRLVEVAYTVPVTVEHLPDGFEIESVDPPTVTATFSGLRRAFYLFRPERLDVTVDVSLAKLGRRTFRLTRDDLEHPKDLTLEQIEPMQVKLSLRKVSAGGADEESGGTSSQRKGNPRP